MLNIGVNAAGVVGDQFPAMLRLQGLLIESVSQWQVNLLTHASYEILFVCSHVKGRTKGQIFGYFMAGESL